MILCVTLNPAIDRTARVERIQQSVVLRPSDVVILPGGKGVNVARAAARLGAIVLTTGIVAGHAGRWILEALSIEGLNPRFVESTVPGSETRTAYTVVDLSGRSVLIYEPSPPVGADAARALLDLLQSELLATAQFVAVCGSVPTDLPSSAVAEIVRLCRNAGRFCLVDTSGPALRAALGARPDAVKVSLEEAEEVLTEHRKAPSRAGGRTVGAARGLVAAGASIAVVTDGPRPVGVVSQEGAWIIDPPQIRTVSPIGSGDALTAGLLVALQAGWPLVDAVAHGVAAGGANALELGAGRFDPAEVALLLGRVGIRSAS